MSRWDKFGRFIVFALLTIITLGLYPLYFTITMWQECNALLKDIREGVDKLRG